MTPAPRKSQISAKPKSKSGYCYLDFFHALNRSIGCDIDVDRLGAQLGSYPLFRRVVGYLVSYASRDVLVPGVRLVGPRMFHVDKRLPPITLSDLISIALFTDARIGADPAAVRSDNVGMVTQLCKLAGISFNDVAAEAARKQIDKCMHMPESFLNDAIRPLVPAVKQRFEIPYLLDTDQVAALQSAYPELNVTITGKIAHSHPYAAAATICAEELILRKLNYDPKAAVEAGYAAAVVDVGANYPRHAKKNRHTIHCCVPIIDIRDSARETSRTETLKVQVRRGKLSADTANAYINQTPTKVRCYKRAEACNVRAPAMMFVHSQYDVPMDAFRAMLDAHQPRTVISVLNFIPTVFYEDAGKCDTLGVQFRREGEKIVFDFIGDSSMGYWHDLANLKQIYTTQVVVTAAGRTYLVERFCRGSALFLQYTYCEIKPQTSVLSASFSFWDNICENTVVLATWDYDAARFSASKFKTIANPVLSFKRKYITVDRRFYDLLYAHCIRSGDKSFNFNEVFSAGLTFNSKMSINGNDIRAVNRVCSVDFVHAVVAIYSIAYRDRYEAGKSIEAFVGAEKSRRAARHVGLTNFFGAAWKAFAEAGFLDALKTSWNNLLDAMANVYSKSEVDVALFQAVRSVQFSEFLTVHGKFSDFNEQIIKDVGVTAVNVNVSEKGLLGEIIGIVREKVSQEEVVELPDDPREEPLVPSSANTPVDPWNNVQPIVTNKRLRHAKTEFHRLNSKKTSENSQRLANVRKDTAACVEKLVVVAVPGDGHCVYHSLGMFCALPQDKLRRVLYDASDVKDENMLLLDGSRDGCGSTDAVTTFTKVYRCRICVHVIKDGVPFDTQQYTHESVPADAPVRHIRWSIVGEAGHVDVLLQPGQSPLLPALVTSSDDSLIWDEDGEDSEWSENGEWSLETCDSDDEVRPLEPSKTATVKPLPAPRAPPQPAPRKIQPLEPEQGTAQSKLDAIDEEPDLSEPLVFRASQNAEEDECIVIPPAVKGSYTLTYDETHPFLVKHGLDPEFSLVPLLGDDRDWSELAAFAAAVGGDDRVANVKDLGVYDSHLFYDYDGVFALFPGKTYAFASASVYLPASLEDTVSYLNPEAEDVYDVVLSTEYDALHFARVTEAYVVQVANPMVALADHDGYTKLVFRGKFTPLLDMTAYVLYHKVDKRIRIPGWRVEMVRALNHVINKKPPLTKGELSMMLAPMSAGGVLEALTEIQLCNKHDDKDANCTTCVYLTTPTTPLVVQSLWASLRRAVLDEWRTFNNGRDEPLFGRPQRLNKAIVHYLRYEQRRVSKTGFTADGLRGYEDVKRMWTTRLFDDVTRSYAKHAIDISQPGQHKVECGSTDPGKVLVAETFGVVSKLDVGFRGAQGPKALVKPNTRFADIKADVRRVHTSVQVYNVAKTVRDVGTSTTTEVQVFVLPVRERAPVSFARSVSLKTMGTQTAGFAGVTRSDVCQKPKHTASTTPANTATTATGTSDDTDVSLSTQSSAVTKDQGPDNKPDVSAVATLKPTPTLKPASNAKDVRTRSVGTKVMNKVSKAVSEIKKRITTGNASTSSSIELLELQQELSSTDPPRMIAEIKSRLPVDDVTDVLAVEGLWLNYPWDTKIHLICVDYECTVFPESFTKRHHIRKKEQLFVKGFAQLSDVMWYNSEFTEFLLLLDGKKNEAVVRAFFAGLPKNCARVSVESTATISEFSLSDIIKSTQKKVCMVTQRHKGWKGLISVVNPEAKPLAPMSTPLAFPKLSGKELGYVPDPPWFECHTKTDAYRNAMVEFLHTTRHADEFNKQTFRRFNFDSKNGPADGQLQALCSEGVYVYDNRQNNKRFLGTNPRQKFLHAYSPRTDTYVPWDDKTNGFVTSENFVLTSRFTETMLNQQIYANIKDISITHVARPEIQWINGPPGCGKTYTIVQTAKMSDVKMKGIDLILSMTKEGRESIVKAMQEKYPNINRDVIMTHVRTVASVLVNGSKTKYERVLLDEALMAHAGTIGYVAALTGTKTVLIIGDINQIPYVDRDHMCRLQYYSPACFADISSVLEITYRCPKDVTFALHGLYDGLCTRSTVTLSMHKRNYSAEKTSIRKDLTDCLYLVHFQADKDSLIREGYGTGKGSKVLTIHEAQGLTFKNVICIRTNSKALALYEKLEYAVVAISRHTVSFTYYTDQADAITKLMDRARLSEPELCIWNEPRLKKAMEKLKPRLTAGGLLYEETMYLERRMFETDENLTVGLPHITHAPLRPHKVHRITNCLNRVPSWKGAAECDVAYLQAFYDSVMPEVAAKEYSWDQMMMECEDTYLRCTNIDVHPNKGLYKAPTFGTLRPRLRTIMQKRKVRSQKESLLGAIKRNLNAPELANPSLSPAEIGRALFKNFERSGVDPARRSIYEAYRDDPVQVSSPVIAEWLEKQPPSRRAQIVSDLPMHLRPYNTFNYMVKTDVKPQLATSASNTYPSVQTIIYNDPSVNAIFCPIFNVLFERFISVLHPKILMLTGLSKVDFEKEFNARITPELAARLRTIEDDFSKFDKAQAEALRVLEDLLWRALGLDSDLADIWDASRRKSTVRDRDGGISFRTEFQRKSGEATTFSGNTIVSICVLLGIIDIDDIVLLLAAGDDTLVYIRDGVVISDASRLIADLFNLECKLLDRYHVPYFCSAFLIPTQNWTYVVPDPLKFVTKLGRHDMKNYEHVEEYRISCVDTMQSLFNSEVSQGLSLAICERYGGYIGDMSKLQFVLRTICHSKELFASLFLHDRGVRLYQPPRKVKEVPVTAAL